MFLPPLYGGSRYICIRLDVIMIERGRLKEGISNGLGERRGKNSIISINMSKCGNVCPYGRSYRGW